MRRRASPSSLRTSPSPPRRKVLALPGTTAASNDVKSLFECQECCGFVLPPIPQCENGHLVCRSCRPKLTRCPICKGQLGSIRNLALEKVADTMLFPCKYTSCGCEKTLRHTEKADHEEICKFRPYPCPCPGTCCKWRGALHAISPHLMQHHESVTTIEGADVVFLATNINIPGPIDWVMLQHCFGFHFMLVLEKQEIHEGHQQFFAIAQLLGTRKQAENFAYRFQLTSETRRLTWEGTPRSIDERIAAAIVKSDCFVFETNTAEFFAEDNNLSISVTIFMY
ncbi:E3 ubiquitin-protein ligase SIAH1-like [Hyaena hyaena]|uniref:E3 ubiquitin-protein ligase SIAH1-like n=1 Tax=Hyaena hyaena TaxID=95912 RepID=UPI001924BA74|nr:E3 ubiquitin-protein ligase SIAH1-like [Hyaena hyaena]